MKASSKSSTTRTCPWSRQAGPARSLVSSPGSNESMCSMPDDQRPHWFNKHRGRVRTVLCLAQQVDRHHQWIRILVGNDQYLRRPARRSIPTSQTVGV